MTREPWQHDAPACAEHRPRAHCLSCHKPRATCICASVLRVHNRTRVVVLQHPRERFHPIGTVRLLELGLGNVDVEIAFHSRTASAPPELSPRAALLYPGSGARELSSMPPSERPDELVVIDGTWHHARSLHRDFHWLRALPCVTLTPGAPSRYRIRREPRAECLSTVEAVVNALKLLEPDTPGLDGLLSAFDAMIDRQLQFVRARPGGRRPKKSRPRPGRALPEALLPGLAELVVCYAETALLDDGSRELVQLVALRMATGELFERIVAREVPNGLHHMQLDAADLERGVSPQQLVAEWERFRAPRALVAAWNQSTLDAMSQAGLENRGLLLKAVYANSVKRAPGTLEAVIAREALQAPRLPLRGRAAQRLANAARIAELLSSLAGSKRTGAP